jgi:hypothetical protein
MIIGTRRGVMSGEDGKFRIVEVPAGSHHVRVTSLGMPGIIEIPVDVTAGTTSEIGDLVLNPDVPSRPAPVSIGSRAEVLPSDLVATIRPASKFKIGDKALFEVRIHNHAAHPALLVQSVDASDAGASPNVKIEIVGPEGGFVVPGGGRCGNRNGASASDFIEVQPGGKFDPYAGGWLGANLAMGRFAKSGRYTATFHYKTTEQDPRSWMAGPCMGCQVPDFYRDLLERVPAVDLMATTTFEVRK